MSHMSDERFCRATKMQVSQQNVLLDVCERVCVGGFHCHCFANQVSCECVYSCINCVHTTEIKPHSAHRLHRKFIRNIYSQLYTFNMFFLISLEFHKKTIILLQRFCRPDLFVFCSSTSCISSHSHLCALL